MPQHVKTDRRSESCAQAPGVWDVKGLQPDHEEGRSSGIAFNRAALVGNELRYVQDAAERGRLASGGSFTRRCTEWLERRTGCSRAFLTPSCTHSLEMAVLVAGIAPGDEVIVPSWTFPSTATSIALRGAIPVWVDVRTDTLNLDEQLVEGAIGTRTRAVLPVHYAGVACEMETILEIAAGHGLLVIEDAAHCIMASYRGRALGSLGDIGCLSFDEQKNVTCGEGGALLVRDPDMVSPAELAQAKGTDRARFVRGEVDHYSWVDLGSAWASSELAAAFLWGQLEAAEALTARRMEIWTAYHAAFESLEQRGLARRPIVPPDCEQNAHLYYLLLVDRDSRDTLIDRLRERGITAAFHYVPLHSSPGGRRYGRAHGKLPITEAVADRLVRLPLWPGLDQRDVERVVDAVLAAVG